MTEQNASSAAAPARAADAPASSDRPPSPEEVFALLGRLDAGVAAIKADVDQIIEPLVRTLKQNQYFDELQAQLRRAERVSQAWRDWPLLTGVHDAVLMLRQENEPDRHLLEHLEQLIRRVGVEEYGLVGDAVEADEADIVASSGSGGRFVVSVCRRPGLRIGAVPLRKPIVEVNREERSAG